MRTRRAVVTFGIALALVAGSLAAEPPAYAAAASVTTTTLTTSPVSPTPAGKSVTLTANVANASTGTTPSGRVSFKDGARSLGSASLVSGVAHFTVPAKGSNAPTAGDHILTAQYGGDASHSTSTGSAALTVYFPDYPPSGRTGQANPFYADIAWLVGQGVTTGYADGDFRPTAPVSRQAMAAFLYRLQKPGQRLSSCTRAPFPDVPAKAPFCAEINWLEREQITGGYADGGFHPTAPVSRQAMAAFLDRLSGQDRGTDCAFAPFTDVPGDSPFCGAITWLASAGIASGYGDCGFHPGAAVSRQAMAAFLDRMSNPSSLTADAAAAGGRFVPLAVGCPVLDTQRGLGAAQGALGSLNTVTVAVAGRGPIPAAGASAVAVQVTASSAWDGGGLTVYADGADRPLVPNVALSPDQDSTALVVTAVAANGAIAIYNASDDSVDISVKVLGYYTAGTATDPGAFIPLRQKEVLDTSDGIGLQNSLAAGRTAALPLGSGSAVPSKGASSVLLYLTVDDPSEAGEVTVYGDAASRPAATSLAFDSYRATTGLVLTQLGSDGTVRFYNNSPDAVDVTATLAGYFVSGLPAAAGTTAPVPPRRIVDTRVGLGAGKHPVAVHGAVSVGVLGSHGVPSGGVSDVAVVVAARAPSEPGALTLHADGTALPTQPNVLFGADSDASATLLVPVGADGKISIHDDSGAAVDLTVDIVGFVLGADRSVAETQPAAKTNVLAASDVVSVSGDPAGTQTVVLKNADAAQPAKTPSDGARVSATQPPVVAGCAQQSTLNKILNGNSLALGPSSSAPQGLLGTITKTTVNKDGTCTFQTRPATLDEVYTTFDVGVSTTLAKDKKAADKKGAKFDLGVAKFVCKNGSKPSISIDADLSDIKLDFNLSLRGPKISVRLEAKPKFTLAFQFVTSVTCTLSSKLLTLSIPVSAIPPIVISLQPEVTVSATGKVGVTAAWQPDLVLGFSHGAGANSNTHTLTDGTPNVRPDGSATLSASLEGTLSVTLAGRTGISGSFGPKIDATLDKTGCVNVEASLGADLKLTADIFFKTFTFTIASGVFGKHPIYQCAPRIITTTLPAATLGQAYSTQLTTADHRRGTWAIASGSLPDGLKLSDYAIKGTPTKLGTSRFTLKFTDAENRTATAVATLSVTGDVTLTFDEVDYGSDVTTQYQPLGVTFTGAAPYTKDDDSNDTSPVLAGSGGFGSPIHASFVNPDGTARVVGTFALDVGYIDNPGSTEVLAFDSDGRLLKSVVVNDDGIVRVPISAAGIASFAVESVFGDDNGWAIDNLSFPGFPNGSVRAAGSSVPAQDREHDSTSADRTSKGIQVGPTASRHPSRR